MKRMMPAIGAISGILLGMPAYADDRPIVVEIRVLQVSPERVDEEADLASLKSTGIDVLYKGELPKGFPALPEPPTVSLDIDTQQPDGSSTHFQADALGLAYVPADGEIALDGKTFNIGVNADQPESAFRCVASPRVAVNPGQKAEIVMGRTLRYLEPVEGGLYRAVDAPDAFEGLKAAATASRTSDGGIQIDELSLTLSEAHSRERLPEIALDVGKPRMRSSTLTATNVRIPDGKYLMVPFHDAARVPQVNLIVLIAVADMPQQPTTGSD